MSGGGLSSRQKGFIWLQMQQAAKEERIARKRFKKGEREQIEEARAKARRGARGRGGTILTSGMGLLEPPPTERKRLLGE